MWNVHFNKNTSVSVNNLSFHYSCFWVAWFPGHLPVRFLDRIVTFELFRECGEGLVQLLHHQTTRWTQTWRNVSVVMATCPRTRTAIDSKRHKTTRLFFQFIAMTKKKAQLLKPSPHYIMIESTLRFDDVGVVPGFLLLLRAVQKSPMWSKWETVWERG